MKKIRVNWPLLGCCAAYALLLWWLVSMVLAGCTPAPARAEAAALAPSPIGAVTAQPIAPAGLEPRWPGVFIKRGPIQPTLRGSLSDPETRIVDGRWHLWISHSVAGVQSIEHAESAAPVPAPTRPLESSTARRPARSPIRREAGAS
jgi:hypothetical protein